MSQTKLLEIQHSNPVPSRPGVRTLEERPEDLLREATQHLEIRFG